MTLSALFALVLAIVSACAAPRPAAHPRTYAGSTAPVETAEQRTGAPHEVALVAMDGRAAAEPDRPARGAPQDANSVTWEGTLAYALPSFGDRYLAIRQPRGTRVVVCGPADCVTRISTDFGPSPEMARQGRIADVSAADFERLCGMDAAQRVAVGLCPGTVTLAGLPATSTK